MAPVKAMAMSQDRMQVLSSIKFGNSKSNKYAKTRNLSNQNPNSVLKFKSGIARIINSQNTKRTYGQPSEQLLP